jgi:hypothetical protein
MDPWQQQCNILFIDTGVLVAIITQWIRRLHYLYLFNDWWFFLQFWATKSFSSPCVWISSRFLQLMFKKRKMNKLVVKFYLPLMMDHKDYWFIDRGLVVIYTKTVLRIKKKNIYIVDFFCIIIKLNIII